MSSQSAATPPTVPAPLASSRPVEPVREEARIQALDVARGVALLGIILVNIAYFAGPLGATMSYRPPADASLLDTIGWWIGKGLTEGNFYSMFATLFGVGLAIQFADAPQGKLAGRAARRLGFLMLVGFLHAMLVWYGDILFMYACFGVVAVLMVRLSARTLLALGSGVLVFSALLLAMMMWLGLATSTPDEKLALMPELDATKTPFFRLIEMFDSHPEVFEPSNAVYMAMEVEAYAHGPYLDLFLFRAMNWVLFLVFALLGMGWSVLGLIVLGMGLFKSGFFADARASLQRRFAVVGLPIGLAVVLGGVLLMGMETNALATALGILLRTFGNVLVALGMLSLIALLCRTGSGGWLRAGLSRMGKMTLSNYLLQSLVCTTIFYFYGFGLFNTLSEIQRVGVAVGVWLLGFTLSWFLAPRLAFGPVEWLWRSVTYWRVQPLLRTRA